MPTTRWFIISSLLAFTISQPTSRDENLVQKNTKREPCQQALQYSMQVSHYATDPIISAESVTSEDECAIACDLHRLCTAANWEGNRCVLTSTHMLITNLTANPSANPPSPTIVPVDEGRNVTVIMDVTCPDTGSRALDVKKTLAALQYLMQYLRMQQASMGTMMGNTMGNAMGSVFGGNNMGIGNTGGTYGSSGMGTNNNMGQMGGTTQGMGGQCGRPMIQPNLNAMSLRALELEEGRIMGGIEAIPNSWPWQVLISLVVNGGRSICGGSIIHSRAIISAAHCFEQSSDPSRYEVYVGLHRRQPLDATKRVIVESIHVYPNYGQAMKHASDLAIIKLAQDIQFNAHVQPVCLSTTRPQPGKQCVITGWGKDDFGKASITLQQAVVKIIPTETCNSPAYYNGRIHALTMFCAADTGVDSCQGDSGGPLVCPSPDGTWQLQGLVSWGIGCGDPMKPGVYVRAEQFRSWISNIIGGSAGNLNSGMAGSSGLAFNNRFINGNGNPWYTNQMQPATPTLFPNNYPSVFWPNVGSSATGFQQQIPWTSPWNGRRHRRSVPNKSGRKKN